MIRLIVAIDRQRGLAKHGILPWYIPEDEQYFTDQTKTHGGHVLTGGTTFRKTYKGRPLADRKNYILTHKDEPIKGVEVVHDLTKFLKDSRTKDLWVAGGAEVFAQIMQAGKADELYITHIDADFRCDQFFPDYEKDFKLAKQTEPHHQNGFTFTYAQYVKT
jgi:dihydrofolate reductase